MRKLATNNKQLTTKRGFTPHLFSMGIFRRVAQSRKGAGFTLIELLVSMGIFSILLALVVNIFITSLRTQRSMVALMNTNDNASLALEQMARELRTGFNFVIGDPLPGLCTIIGVTSGQAGDKLSFCNAGDKVVTYRLDNSELQRKIGSDNFLSITAPNVKIGRLNFNLAHLGLAGSWPPRIVINMAVSPKGTDLEGFITNIQTTVSGRNI